jgi:hypothetical protein
MVVPISIFDNLLLDNLLIKGGDFDGNTCQMENKD